MRKKRSIVGLLILCLTLFRAGSSLAQPAEGDDKTHSPYFFVKSDDPRVDRLPLKSTNVRTVISGVIADVTATQIYQNQGQKPLEAIYVFPASTRAAVYGMKMQIGERIITAKIRERDAARRQYDQARQAGKSASLLEQHRPNVFQMNVANILPGDVIRVELKYTELLIPNHGVYEFSYPTVVGPRYGGDQFGQDLPTEKWIANPYLQQGEPPTSTFDMKVSLHAGLGIQDITCPTHKVDVGYNGAKEADIRLAKSEPFGGDRDYILKYRLAGDKIQSGLLLYEGDQENFFLLMIQPPKRVRLSQVPSREYIFIVDVSGSMHGFPLEITQKLIKELIGGLRPTDRFNVVLFAGGSALMSPRSLPATRANIQRAVNLIDRQRGGGGTRLLPALEKALSLPGDDGWARSIVIATDGYVAVEEEAFEIIRKNLGQANMFAFGIGSSVNRHLIEGMARVGMGEPFVITGPEDTTARTREFRRLIASPVLTDVSIEYEGFEAYDVEPPGIPDLLAERPVIIFGKYRGRPKGTIRLQGISGQRPYFARLDASQVKPTAQHSALGYLWARHRIALLSDYNRLRADDDRVRAVTRLGLKYNLLTAYTSFIAVDTQKRDPAGQAVTVKQPLPLPRGVSSYALGRSLGSPQILRSKAAEPPAAGFGRRLPLAEEKASDEIDQRQTLPDKEKTRTDRDAREALAVSLGKTKVTGGLIDEDVRTVLKQHLRRIDQCWRQAVIMRTPEELVIRLVIDASGRVAKAEIENDSLLPLPFRHCLLAYLKQMIFPRTQARLQTAVKVTYTLN